MDRTSPPLPRTDEEENKMSQPHNTQSKPTAMRQVVAGNGYLFTPPERIDDSFSQQTDNEKPAEPQTKPTTLAPLNEHTPPASPQNAALPSINRLSIFSPEQDATLYPEDKSDAVESQTPLFATENTAARPGPSTSQQSAPTGPVEPPVQPARREIFPAILGVRDADSALQYYQDRMRELRDFQQARSTLSLPVPRPRPSYAQRDDVSMSQLSRMTRPAGVVKNRAAPRPAATPKATAPASTRKASTPKKAPAKKHSRKDSSDADSPKTPVQKYSRAPPTKKKDEDKREWSELPDFSPPTSTLDGPGVELKANWDAVPLDLSDDPDRDHLHAQELKICRTLRLPCVQYLYNKRKIFMGKLARVQEGKSFTKTKAQEWCNMDVNKASRLWQAFDEVGWFKEAWFARFLDCNPQNGLAAMVEE